MNSSVTVGTALLRGCSFGSRLSAVWPHHTRRQLRSATTGIRFRARTSTGQRSFAVFGPATWNSLPPSLRAPNCRSAPSSACWRLSFSSTREPSSGAVDSTASSAPHTNTRTQLNSTIAEPFPATQERVKPCAIGSGTHPGPRWCRVLETRNNYRSEYVP